MYLLNVASLITGHTLTGQDVQITGIATHFVSSDRLPELEKALCLCTNDSDVKATLDKFHETTSELSIAPHIKDIDFCFSAASIDEIIFRLTSINNKWSTDTIKVEHLILLERLCSNKILCYNSYLNIHSLK